MSSLLRGLEGGWNSRQQGEGGKERKKKNDGRHPSTYPRGAVNPGQNKNKESHTWAHHS